MNKEYVWIILEMTFLIGSGIGIGWAGNELYNNITNHRNIDGLYMENYDYLNAREKANEMDNGDWVCINVKGMDFSRGIDVCTHECGHAVYSEIYAEKCEMDAQECIGEIK